MNGFYGALALMGSLSPFGSGTELSRNCTALGAESCGTPMPVGGGLAGTIGYARDPFGLEVFLGVLGDFQRPSAHFDGSTHQAHGDPLLAAPARNESFIIVRGGAMVAARVRLSKQWSRFRTSVAVGPGLAWRYMALEREVTTFDGAEDRPYFSRGTSYVSPALSLEGQIQWRATPTLAVYLGLGFWIESAGNDTRSVADTGRYALGAGKAYPLNTPAYSMAYGLQFMLLPQIGLAFGP
ncbi:MAG TPA: hypothetical protein VNO21_12610 [Polyangiaceae bacterium]|nr:hypothetical protein [Polyangiaceae bacterium]